MEFFGITRVGVNAENGPKLVLSFAVTIATTYKADRGRAERILLDAARRHG